MWGEREVLPDSDTEVAATISHTKKAPGAVWYDIVSFCAWSDCSRAEQVSLSASRNYPPKPLSLDAAL